MVCENALLMKTKLNCYHYQSSVAQKVINNGRDGLTIKVSVILLH